MMVKLSELAQQAKPRDVPKKGLSMLQFLMEQAATSKPFLSIKKGRPTNIALSRGVVRARDAVLETTMLRHGNGGVIMRGQDQQVFKDRCRQETRKARGRYVW